MISPRVYLFAGMVVVLFALGFSTAWKWQGKRLDRLKAQQAQAAALAKAEVAEAEKRAAEATAKVEVRYIERAAKVETVTRVVTKEVPRVITRETDRLFAIPSGFVCVYNRASAGPTEVPGAPCQPDDTPSAIAWSDAAPVIVANVRQYYAVAEQLTALQDWVRAQADAAKSGD